MSAPVIRLLLTAGLLSTLNLLSADLSGSWSGTMETRRGQVELALTLIDNGRELTGWMALGLKGTPVEVDEPRVQFEGVSFHVRDSASRQTNFSLSMRGTGLKGEARVEGEVANVSLSKAVYTVGSGASVPSLLYKVEPEYSEQARAARLEGTVMLHVEVNPSGVVRNATVVRGLGSGLDEKAIEAAERWRFRPGHKDGVPVTTAVSIEVHFRLYSRP